MASLHGGWDIHGDTSLDPKKGWEGADPDFLLSRFVCVLVGPLIGYLVAASGLPNHTLPKHNGLRVVSLRPMGNRRFSGSAFRDWDNNWKNKVSCFPVFDVGIHEWDETKKALQLAEHQTTRPLAKEWAYHPLAQAASKSARGTLFSKPPPTNTAFGTVSKVPPSGPTVTGLTPNTGRGFSATMASEASPDPAGSVRARVPSIKLERRAANAEDPVATQSPRPGNRWPPQGPVFFEKNAESEPTPAFLNL
jgi:hypothetical protein